MAKAANVGVVREEPFKDALSERYLSYAVSTIMARSLPDVRDGLKPVHRRLLYAMRQLHLDPEQGFKKCARVVGDVIGKYHPHGDTAVYDAMVRLAQEFAARYPRIEFDVRFTDRQVDMIEEAYDLAIWPGAVPDSILITRKLAKVRWAMVASPAYLDARGRPARPGDLADHDIILYALDSGRWRLRGPTGWEQVRINSRFCTDNGQMLLAAARASLGIVLVPMFMVEEPLARGEFQAVLPDFPHEGGDLQIFMPPARAGIARVRALVDFLYEKFDREV